MVEELTWSYTGVIVRFDDGVLFDPVTGIELLIDNQGQISSTDNVSIRGNVNNDGTFQWSGLREEHGRLNSIFVKGALASLPASARAGSEFDGVYHLTDSGTGRQQLARINDGFYTWSFLDGEVPGFTPWPTLIRPDGTFSFSIDMVTVMEMGGVSTAHFSTNILIEGRVIPGQGISMEEITRTAGLGTDQADDPHIFSGTTIRSGEFPNESIPDTIENVVTTGRAAARALPKPNRADFPSWYLKLPKKEGFIFAAGEKTFDTQEIAFAMAEAAAAANLIDQIIMRITSTTIEKTTDAGTMIDDRIKAEAAERLNYRIAEQVYNPETRTAFVLLEMPLE